MSITLNFELNDQDLAHFKQAAERSKQAAEGKSTEEIVASAVAMLADAQKIHIPDFIKDRLLRLDDMIAMVRDEGWALPEEDRQRVLSALMYFCDPDDVIPDNIEVLGFLDDAVMIELSVRAANCLNNANITSVGQLAQKSEAEMLKYRNFGKKSLNEIKDKLHQLNLSLGMKFEPGVVEPVPVTAAAAEPAAAEEAAAEEETK